jgi:hypothetical protein
MRRLQITAVGGPADELQLVKFQAAALGSGALAWCDRTPVFLAADRRPGHGAAVPMAVWDNNAGERSLMKRSRQASVWGLVVSIGLAASPDAAAEPEYGTSSADAACSQFAGALDLASANYSDFVDVTSGDDWSYRDPMVNSTNVSGRTALRKAASASLGASATPGLQPEIAGPMRRWSLQATKLIVVMGMRGNDDLINAAASDLNNVTYEIQTACANAIA